MERSKKKSGKVSRSIPVIAWTGKDLTRQDRARFHASVRAVVTKGWSATSQLLEVLALNIGRPQTKTIGIERRVL